MSNQISIEWIQDYTDCETCGGSGAEGAIVKIGEHVIDMTPHAHCYDSVNYSEGQVYEAILEHLGYVVFNTHTCNDEEF